MSRINWKRWDPYKDAHRGTPDRPDDRSVENTPNPKPRRYWEKPAVKARVRETLRKAAIEKSAKRAGVERIRAAVVRARAARASREEVEAAAQARAEGGPDDAIVARSEEERAAQKANA